jgi:uncharacterized RDD family membrane protein YckC
VVFSSYGGEIFGYDWELTGAEGETARGRVSVSVVDLVNLALLAILTVVLWVNWDGRTPGKKLLRVRIVSYPGYEPLSYGTATVRAALSTTGR